MIALSWCVCVVGSEEEEESCEMRDGANCSHARVSSGKGIQHAGTYLDGRSLLLRPDHLLRGLLLLPRGGGSGRLRVTHLVDCLDHFCNPFNPK
jgi:hypothetical protein